MKSILNPKLSKPSLDPVKSPEGASKGTGADPWPAGLKNLEASTLGFFSSRLRAYIRLKILGSGLKVLVSRESLLEFMGLYIAEEVHHILRSCSRDRDGCRALWSLSRRMNLRMRLSPASAESEY